MKNRASMSDLKPFERARVKHLGGRGKKLRIITAPAGTEELYEDRAVVSNNPSKIKVWMRGGKDSDWKVNELNTTESTVILPLKAMTNDDFRDLFWLNVQELWIGGKKKKMGLCGECKHFTKCTLGGLLKEEGFKCRTQRKLLRFLISRKSKRRVTSPTGLGTSPSH